MSNRRRLPRCSGAPPLLGPPLEVWTCPVSGDVHALVLVDVDGLPPVEGAERPTGGGRRPAEVLS